MKIPFDLYDFFGYLSTGLVVLVAMELVLGFPPVLQGEPNVIQSLLLLLAGYVAGHSLATPASALLEHLIVGNLLGRPSEHLLKPSRSRLRFVFPGYYKPLPARIRSRICEQAKTESSKIDPQALFLRARYSPEVQDNEKTMARLGKFLAQYGFARNMTFVLFLLGGTLISFGLARGSDVFVQYGGVAIIAAGFLFYRYLKFYRQYAYETLLACFDL